MFTHVKSPELIELKTGNHPKISGRFYKTPDGQMYPSVTTVLSATEEDDGIRRWKERVGEEEANRVLIQAGIRGTAVHDITERYLNNWEHTVGQMPANIFTFNTIKDILDDRINNIWYLEAPLYSHFLKIAGRVDCIAEYEGKLSVIDFKTSRKTKKKEWIQNYFMQTSAYAVMFEERTKKPVKQLVIIIAVDDNDPQVFVEDRDEHIHNFIKQRNKYKEMYSV